MGSLFKNIIAVVFIPLIISTSKSFYAQLSAIKTFTHEGKYFIFGFLAYIFVYIALPKTEYIYAFGHELVHAIFVWLFGGSVGSFKVSKKGGSVSTNKTNIFIYLGPYMVPIYTILISILYLIVSSFWEITVFYKYFIFLAGFTFSFHIVMTIDKMKSGQSDFLSLGYLNSLVIIYIVNILIISLFLVFLVPEFSFVNFVKSAFSSSKELYTSLFNRIFQS